MQAFHKFEIALFNDPSTGGLVFKVLSEQLMWTQLSDPIYTDSPQ